MAQLTIADKKEIWAEFMTAASGDRDPLPGITKQDLLAVVDAIDTWIDDVSSVFIAAIPEPGRTMLTTKQKLLMFIMIIKKRWEVV